jgi:hypothetical protein
MQNRFNGTFLKQTYVSCFGVKFGNAVIVLILTTITPAFGVEAIQ